MQRRFQREYGAMPQIAGFDRGYLAKAIQQFPKTAAEMNALIGYSPMAIHLFNETSGNCTDELGGAALVPVNSPPQGVGTAFPGQKSVDTTASGEYAAMASSATYDDDGSTSFAELSIVILGAKPAGLATLYGKRSGAVQWRCFMNSSGHLFYLNGDGTTLVQAEVAQDHSERALVILTITDRNAALAKLQTPLGGESKDISSVLSMSNAGTYGIGKVTIDGPPMLMVYQARFEGAQAEGMNASAIVSAFYRGP